MAKKRAGVGATCSAPIRFVRPKRLIDAKFPTIAPQQRLTDLLALRKETRRLNGRDQLCVVYRHDSFPNEELLTHSRYCKVETEGPTDHLFGNDAAPEAAAEEVGEEVPEEVLHAHSEDVNLIRNAGFDVDDDNEPAPENIPVEGETVDLQQTWGWSGICNRKATGVANHPPRLNGKSDVESKSMTFLSLFLWFFPLNYLHNVLLKQLNLHLEASKERGIGLGEFLRYLGIWFYMSTFKGVSRNQFWSSKDIDDFDGAPIRLNNWM